VTFNNAYEVLFAASYMHLRHADKLETASSSYSLKTVWQFLDKEESLK